MSHPFPNMADEAGWKNAEQLGEIIQQARHGDVSFLACSGRHFNELARVKDGGRSFAAVV